MGAGCLSPKPRIGQIYIDSINQIYQQAKEFQINALQKQTNQNIYQTFKTKIIKKGLLKKLMDYLQCHRSMISEALLYNYRIMIQSKSVQSKLTSLIIVDYIIAMVQKKNNMSQNLSSLILMNHSKNGVSTYQQSQVKKQIIQSDNDFRKRSDQHYNNYLTEKQNKDPSFDNNQSIMVDQSFFQLLRQIKNVKFHNIYFNMLKQLIQVEQIYQFALNSILVYSCLNPSKSNLQEQMVQIIKTVLQNIKKQNELEKSLRCYYILLEKLKDNNIEKEVLNIKIFFQLWNQMMTNGKNTKDFHSDPAKLKIIIEKIISKFICRGVENNSCNQIYQIILDIYDQKKFTNMQLFEQLLVQVTKNQQLKDKFLKGLFCQFLSYFSVCKPQKDKDLYIWSKLSINKSIDLYVIRYKNIFDRKVKKQLIETLQRWIEQLALINLNNIIRYNLLLFVYSFQFNILTSHNSQSNTFLTDKFCYMCGNANWNQKIMIINCLFQQLKQSQKQAKDKINNLYVIDLLLKQKFSITQKYSKTNIFHQIQSSIIHFCPCNPKDQLQVNSEIIKTITKIIKNYGFQSTFTQIDQVCFFLYSIYELILNIQYFQHYFPIIKDVQNLIKQIQNQKGQLIILSFTQRVIKASQIQSTNFNILQILQFLNVLICLLLDSPKLTNRSKYRKTFNKIHMYSNKIKQVQERIKNLNKQQRNSEITKIEEEINKEKDLFESLIIPQIEQFSILNDNKIYQNTSIIFRDMFQRGVSIINCRFKSTKEDIFKQSFRHQNNCFQGIKSVVQIQNANQEQDKSFQDIMDILNV